VKMFAICLLFIFMILFRFLDDIFPISSCDIFYECKNECYIHYNYVNYVKKILSMVHKD